MRRRSPVKSFSNDSDYTGSDTDDSVEPDTDLIDVNEFADNNNKNDENKAWLSLDKDYPPSTICNSLRCSINKSTQDRITRTAVLA
jgi:hypothetical protein